MHLVKPRVNDVCYLPISSTAAAATGTAAPPSVAQPQTVYNIYYGPVLVAMGYLGFLDRVVVKNDRVPLLQPDESEREPLQLPPRSPLM